MTAAERARYALGKVRDSLRGGARTAFRYGGTAPAGPVAIAAPPLRNRLRQAPAVLRRALAAVREESQRAV